MGGSHDMGGGHNGGVKGFVSNLVGGSKGHGYGSVRLCARATYVPSESRNQLMAASSDPEGSGSGHRRGSPLVFDELRWVVQIRDSLTEDADDEDDNGIPVSVFNVPKQLQVHNPEAYVPQFIALGPYHHWRPELYEMERYKLAAARRAQRRLGPAGLKLDALVAQFACLERKVRAYYHRYLDFSGETLSWMMVVDGAFLLEFLQIYAAADGGHGGGGGKPALGRVSSRMVCWN
ncbi:hypothetical protein ACQ4PT_014875 [Festuca glaucescens]